MLNGNSGVLGVGDEFPRSVSLATEGFEDSEVGGTRSDDSGVWALHEFRYETKDLVGR